MEQSKIHSYKRRLKALLAGIFLLIAVGIVIESKNIILKSVNEKSVSTVNSTQTFTYVEELMKNHAFSRLKGLLYFTDGQGIYPLKRPPFETAFVFMKEDYEDVDVPAWAMKLILEEERYDEYKTSETRH